MESDHRIDREPSGSGNVSEVVPVVHHVENDLRTGLVRRPGRGTTLAFKSSDHVAYRIESRRIGHHDEHRLGTRHDFDDIGMVDERRDVREASRAALAPRTGGPPRLSRRTA